MPTRDLRMLPHVELLRVGKFAASTGSVEFTAKDLESIVRASHDPEIRRAPIVVGHHATDPEIAADGQPAKGYVDNLSVETEGDHTSLYGDLIGMPVELASGAQHNGAYPSRSVEVRWAVKTPSGNTYPAALERLALLGATRPAIEGLRPVQGLYKTAASAAYMDEGRTTLVRFAAPTTEGDTVDLTALRSALGLGADVPDDQVIAKASEGITKASATPPAVDPWKDLESYLTAEREHKTKMAAGNMPETVTIDKATFDSLQQGLTRLGALEEDKRTTARDSFLSSAVREGKITPASLDTWRGLYDAAPEQTTKHITALAASTAFSVTPGGHSESVDALGGDDAMWAEFAATSSLFPNPTKGA